VDDMMINHRKNWLVALLAVAVAAVLPVAGAGAKSGSSNNGLKSFHGTVSSVSTANKTFQIRRSGAGTLTFRVTSTTVFQRLGGRLGALREGRAIEVKGKRVDGRWVARKIEPDDDGASHDAGDDRGGADDGARHDAGDDHGGDRDGHGADD
jgi:hypothetical protein